MKNIYCLTHFIPFLLLMMMVASSASSVYAQTAEDSVTSVLQPALMVLDDYGNPIDGVTMIDGEANVVANSNAEGLIFLDTDLNGLYEFAHKHYYTNRKNINLSATSQEVLHVYLKEKIIQSPERINQLYKTGNSAIYLGASTSANTDQINTALSNNFLQSLPGRLTGLYTQQYAGMRTPQTSGNSNADLIGNIPVNGNGSPTDNQQFYLSARGMTPVTVIDGIQREMFSIDPENIASITLQKDALSSILLGMRSSRGVLLVETKKPEDDQLRLSFTGQWGSQNLLNVPEPLAGYEYAYLLNEALQFDGKLPAYTSEDFQEFRNGTSPFTHPDVNWYNQILKREAPVSSYNLNVSGGGKTARYSVGLSYLNQEGHFISSDINSYQTNLGLERYLITSTIDVDVTEDFAVAATLFGRIENGIQPGAGAFNILNDLFRTPNTAYPVYNPNGSYGGNTSFTNNLMSQTINSGYIADNSKDAMVNIKMGYDFGKFVNGLKLTAMSNVSTQSRNAIIRSKRSIVYQYLPDSASTGENAGAYTSYGLNDPQSNGFVQVSNYNSWYGQLNLTYDRDFGEHHVTGTLFSDYTVSNINYDLPNKPVNVALQGKYDFVEKYMAEAAVVHSSFNGYPTGKQSGLFYAFGLGWDLAKEEFLNSSSLLDQLKLRGVFGRTGNGIDNAGYYGWRQSYQNSVTDFTYLQGYSGFNQTATLENTPMANPNITWEKADKLNVGLDVSMLNNHLQVNADVYYDTYFDLLQVRGKAIGLGGFSFPVENIGKSRRTGIEAALTYQNNLGSFNYFLTANWARNSSEVLFMDEQELEEDYLKRTGKPIGSTFGYVANGFFTSTEEIGNYPVFEGYEVKPGDIKYKDLNGDGLINEFDHTAIAGLKPLSFFGVTAGFNVKGFDLSVLLQGAYNREIYIGNEVQQAGFQLYGQQYGQAYQTAIGRWTPETSEAATHPRLTAGGNFYNLNPGFASTSFWVRPGDYIRVKNVSIGYTLPPAISRLIANAQIRIFANATNLLTFSKYDLVDPEVINFTNYPNQRVISAGVNVKF